MAAPDPGTRNRRVGARIRKRRHVLNMEQTDLAAALGVHVNSVQKWESGAHYPARHIGKLEAVLGISLDEPEPEPAVPQDVIDYINRRFAGDPDYRDMAIEALTESAASRAPLRDAPAGPSRSPRRAG